MAGVAEPAPAILFFYEGLFHCLVADCHRQQPDATMGCPNTVINCLCQNEMSFSRCVGRTQNL
jgi:hypothetical protein